MTTDWPILAKKLGSLNDDGSESGSTGHAQEAMQEILGEAWIEHTVEHVISFKPGREVAMNCLRLLQSVKAAKYAYEVYKNTEGERACQAVWLIKHMATPVSIDWVEEFLNDTNVMHWGLGVLDQLLWTNQIPYNDKAEYLIALAEKKSNGHLKEHVDFIRQYINEKSKYA